MWKFIGHCLTEGCPKKGEDVRFEVPPDKVEAFQHEPPLCSSCGQFLVGVIHEVVDEDKVVDEDTETDH